MTAGMRMQEGLVWAFFLFRVEFGRVNRCALCFVNFLFVLRSSVYRFISLQFLPLRPFHCGQLRCCWRLVLLRSGVLIEKDMCGVFQEWRVAQLWVCRMSIGGGCGGLVVPWNTFSLVEAVDSS